jgi:hypothetical protein
MMETIPWADIISRLVEGWSLNSVPMNKQLIQQADTRTHTQVNKRELCYNLARLLLPVCDTGRKTSQRAS